MFDIIIIGAGPTGLTAAIYASRRMMKVLLISKDFGGQVMWTSEVENYPGIKLIKGTKLALDMYDQAKSFGVEIKTEEAQEIIKQRDGNFLVSTARSKYQTRTIIIAMGLAPRKLELPNEKELVGRGVSYCANCDGQFFKDRAVAVVGGGNAALDAAEVMSKIARKVYLIYRKSRLKGFEVLVAEVIKKNNIKIILDSEIIGLTGEEKLEKIKIRKNSDQTEQELAVDGLFVEIGHEPKTEIAAKRLEIVVFHKDNPYLMPTRIPWSIGRA